MWWGISANSLTFIWAALKHAYNCREKFLTDLIVCCRYNHCLRKQLVLRQLAALWLIAWNMKSCVFFCTDFLFLVVLHEIRKTTCSCFRQIVTFKKNISFIFKYIYGYTLMYSNVCSLFIRWTRVLKEKVMVLPRSLFHKDVIILSEWRGCTAVKKVQHINLIIANSCCFYTCRK